MRTRAHLRRHHRPYAAYLVKSLVPSEVTRDRHLRSGIVHAGSGPQSSRDGYDRPDGLERTEKPLHARLKSVENYPYALLAISWQFSAYCRYMSLDPITFEYHHSHPIPYFATSKIRHSGLIAGNTYFRSAVHSYRSADRLSWYHSHRRPSAQKEGSSVEVPGIRLFPLARERPSMSAHRSTSPGQAVDSRGGDGRPDRRRRPVLMPEQSRDFRAGLAPAQRRR